MNQGTLFPDPTPEALGITCGVCGAVGCRTFRVVVDGLHLLRLDCAGCGRFVRHLDPLGVLYVPADADVPDAARRLPRPCRWLGLVRGQDGVWLAVVLAEDLARCWEALLACSLEGDRLCTPVKPRDH
jgi:hypothetical protein